MAITLSDRERWNLLREEVKDGAASQMSKL